MNRLIAIAGPTAVGKSGLALRLCEKFSGELLSFDSMQIYRGLDIGTAKPTKEEQTRIPHHLIDICGPDENFSAADFAAAAHKVIADIISRGKQPFLCGGTGLYLDSVLGRLDFGEMARDDEYRESLASTAREKGNEYLHGMLADIDPDAAESIHPNNIKRVIRALEICKTSGMTKTEWDKKAAEANPPYDSLIIGLQFRDRAILHGRINRRVDLMFESGLENEARNLYEKGYLKTDSTAGQAIGYKELLQYLKGEISLSEAAENIKTATRRYAKRQLTWFNRNKSINWLYPDDYTSEDGLFAAACGLIDNIK